LVVFESCIYKLKPNLVVKQHSWSLHYAIIASIAGETPSAADKIMQLFLSSPIMEGRRKGNTLYLQESLGVGCIKMIVDGERNMLF